MTKRLNNEKGLKAEYCVIEQLQEKGVEIEQINDWYDIEANGEKVEIKSAMLAVHHSRTTKKNNYESGRFDFTKEDSRNKMWDQNIWLCFVARWKSQFMVLGFQKAQQFEKKRYVRLSKLRESDLLSMDEFVERIT